jgi:1,2-diacylglycerol 3-alpha-glucosyltransferase
MRIAMLAACPFPSSQGSQVFIRQMCETLAGRGHDVELLTYGQGESAPPMSTAYRHHRIRRLPGDDALRSGPTLVKPVLDVLLAAKLCTIVRTGRFDVVHAHVFEAAAIAVGTKRVHGVPVVYHCHGVMAEELPSYFHSFPTQRAAAWFGGMFDRVVPRSADLTIALSAAARERLRALGVPNDRLSVLAPAIDEPGNEVSRAAARGALSIDPSRFVVGYCGNLDGYQNLETLAAAIRELIDEGSGGDPLWLVVTHARDPRFAALLGASGLLRWTKVLEARDFAEARRAMAACDALVLPRATKSGFPIKLLNYMAAARPVVTGPAGAAFLEDGREALCVRDGRPSGYAAALARLAEEPGLGAALGAAARRKYEENHTWDAVAPALENAYAHVIGPSRAAGGATAM